MRYIIGSTYFFNKYPDFKSKDIDYLFYNERPDIKKDNKTCVFSVLYIDKIDIMNDVLCPRAYIQISRFLNADFVKDIGFTIEDLKLFYELSRKFKGTHEYLKLVYDFYIQNDSFTLTEEQRLAVYENYKAARPEIYGRKEGSL